MFSQLFRTVSPGSTSRTPLDIMTNRQPAMTAATIPLAILLRTLGREHSGKTALQMAMDLILLGDYLPSGLSLSAADDAGLAMSPLIVNQRLRTTMGRMKKLMPGGGGLPSTLTNSPFNFMLCEGEAPRIRLSMSEEIGQVISNTHPGSSSDELARYGEFQNAYASADVKLVIVSPPSRHPSADAEGQFRQDMISAVAFVNESLRRTTAPATAVGIVLSKLDSLYDSAESARAELTDAAIKECVRPLVRALEMSPKVRYAAIIPTSAFGFGQATSLAHPVFEGEADDTADLGLYDARTHEEAWGLGKDSVIQPYNIQTLVLWSLLAGALPKEVEVIPGQDVPPIARVCRMLKQDLKSLEGWIVPIKGDLVG